MTAKNGLKFESFADQFPRKLEKALPGFRVIRSQGDELEYEYDGFDNALDLKIVFGKFQQSRADLGALVNRYADYVRQFAEQSRTAVVQAQPAVKHYDGYSEKEADWFQKAAQEQRARLNAYAPPPPPPPVSAPSNRHPNVIKVKPRRPPPPPPPARIQAAAVPVTGSPAHSVSKPAPKVRRKSATAKSTSRKKASAKKVPPRKTSPRKTAAKSAPTRTKAASTARHSATKSAKPRFMDRVKKIFGRR